MNKFLTHNGTKTTETDPKRLIWYSAFCGFWIDDWDQLSKVGPGIPCCPICHCVGLQVEAEKWDKGVEEFEIKHPGYTKYLNDHKAHCFSGVGGLTKALIQEVIL